MLDTTYKSIRESGAIPHWFGLGFVQLKLNEKQRMHFWHPDHHPTSNLEEVHNHRYSFCSKIIVGEIVHETWTYTPSDKGDSECVLVSCKPDKPMNPCPCSVGFMSMSGRYTMRTGSTYFFPASGFHRIIAHRAVTLICRGQIETENATVIRSIGATSVCPFSCQKSESECWDIIEDLLENKQITDLAA